MLVLVLYSPQEIMSASGRVYLAAEMEKRIQFSEDVKRIIVEINE